MAQFECRFPELTFFVKGQARQFSAGRYVTEDKEEIEVLSKMRDVVRVDEPKAEEEQKKSRKASK